MQKSNLDIDALIISFDSADANATGATANSWLEGQPIRLVEYMLPEEWQDSVSLAIRAAVADHSQQLFQANGFAVLNLCGQSLFVLCTEGAAASPELLPDQLGPFVRQGDGRQCHSVLDACVVPDTLSFGQPALEVVSNLAFLRQLAVA